jgi:alkanesulfonate monooxygenase SsuD/methylene tetrahydromethanopterin reductase-like flavin-dependent oxidoreductase (luciferase family)
MREFFALLRKPKIVLGALGEGMLRLAGAEADGVLLNYLPASHVSWCVEQVRRGGNARIYANIHVGVGDREAAAPRARYDLATAMPSRPSGPPTARATGPAPWPPYPTRWSTPSTWSAMRHWSAKRSAHTGTLALTSP